MDAQTIEMLKIVLPDAIKILGPALITGIVAYWTAKIQYRSKLEEITGNQSFKAREHLLDYYKKKIEDAGKAVNALNYTLGRILGSTTALDLHNNTGDNTYNKDDVVPELAIVDMHLELCSFEIKTTLRDMESVGIKNTEEYTKLNTYLTNAQALKPSKETSTIKSNIFQLVEIYNFIARCAQLVLESQIHRLFGIYVKNA